jgi:predicted metal-dependent enzyme (double-stranded beta helix superfamily)
MIDFIVNWLYRAERELTDTIRGNPSRTFPVPAPTLLRARPTLDTDAVADIAVTLLACPSMWRGVARFDPDVRRPVRLFADEVIEAWVVGWFAGQALGLHDHGGSTGAIVVAEGRLCEQTLGCDGAPEVPPFGAGGLLTRTLERGIVQRLPPHTVHAIANLDARAATSLHVYSPPLARMTHFDSDDLQAAQTVAVEPEVPVLPSAVAQLMRIDRRV